MRRLIKVALVVLGIRAFLRWRKRRKDAHTDVTSEPRPVEADPADELRQKLAESRDDEATDEASQAADATVEDRRTEVHDQGRSTLEDMKSSDGS